MSEKLVRLQVWVTPKQKANVKKMAKQQKVSESAVIRSLLA